MLLTSTNLCFAPHFLFSSRENHKNVILVLKNPDLGADFQVLVIWINLYPPLRELCLSTFDLENKQKYDFDAEKFGYGFFWGLIFMFY